MSNICYDTDDNPAEHDCAAIEEECAYLKAENSELLAALWAIRDYSRAPLPPLPDDWKAGCRDCERAESRKWPPSGLCDKHYRVIDDRNRADQRADAAQHWELRVIARNVINRVCGGSGISAIRTTGVPGQRDTGAPCVEFRPGNPRDGDCEGDGHYLCDQCTKHSTRLTVEAVDSGPSNSAPVEGDGDRS